MNVRYERDSELVIKRFPMTQNFPLLEAMRAARDAREREATDPVRAKLAEARQDAAWARSELESVREGFKALGRIVASDYGKHIVGALHEQASRDFMPILMDALSQAHKGGGVVNVQIPADMLRWLSPSDAQQAILRETARQIDNRAFVTARRERKDYLTSVSIDVPAFSIRQAVHDEVIDYRQGARA